MSGIEPEDWWNGKWDGRAAFSGDEQESHWRDKATGESGDIELEKHWLDLAEEAYTIHGRKLMFEMYKIFCKKQADYGPKNIALSGTKGVVLRMVDKLSRLWNLLGFESTGEKEIQNKDEGVFDTLMDLCDYALIAMLLECGYWKRIKMTDAFKSQTDGAEQLSLPI